MGTGIRILAILAMVTMIFSGCRTAKSAETAEKAAGPAAVPDEKAPAAAPAAALGQADKVATPPGDRNAPPAGTPAAPEDPRKNQAGGETPQGDDLLKKFKEDSEISKQQNRAEAEAAYRLARDHYTARRYEQAAVEADRAVQLDPDNLSARMLSHEIKVLLGKATPKSLPEQISRYYFQDEAQRQQVVTEVQNAFNEGRRAYNVGDYPKADREFRYVLEVIKYLPFSIDLEKISKESQTMLEKTREARKERELHEELAKRKLADDELKRRDVMRKLDEKRRLQLMFEQAQLEFERARYENAIDLCEKILYINPNMTAVQDMMKVAQKLKHNRINEQNLFMTIEEWKRKFYEIDLKSVVPDDAEIVHWFDKEFWRTTAARRSPKSVRMDEEENISQEDAEVRRKLKASKIGLDFDGATLQTVIDYIKLSTGLNFNFQEGVDKDTSVTIHLKNIAVEDALKHVLGSAYGFFVEDGIVHIATADKIQGRVRWDMYDILDLTIGIQQFPGEDLALSASLRPLDPSLSMPPIGQENEGAFTPDDLKTLIENAIAKGTWGSGDFSIDVSNGVLIVKHTPEVHDRVKLFLRQLREQSTVMVNIEARFMMIEQSMLEDIGIDFRELDTATIPEAMRRVPGQLDLDDISVPFNDTPFNATTSGVASEFGTHIRRPMGARIEQLLSNDLNANRFYTTALSPTGGTQLQYTLLDDISLEAILRMTKKKRRSTVLAAPSITLYNGQRGNVLIVDQLAYIKDYDPQVAGVQLINDPIIDVINQGVCLDVKPVVSADKRFVTLELRPTSARLDPPPPNLASINTSFGPIELPNLLIQRVRTTVIVPDRGTLLVGGLLNYYEVDEVASIPFWKNIPILGLLGSTKMQGKSILQHMVLLRVRIVIPAEEERKTFNEPIVK